MFLPHVTDASLLKQPLARVLSHVLRFSSFYSAYLILSLQALPLIQNLIILDASGKEIKKILIHWNETDVAAFKMWQYDLVFAFSGLILFIYCYDVRCEHNLTLMYVEMPYASRKPWLLWMLLWHQIICLLRLLLSFIWVLFVFFSPIFLITYQLRHIWEVDILSRL